jgi:hypothetical protein
VQVPSVEIIVSVVRSIGLSKTMVIGVPIKTFVELFIGVRERTFGVIGVGGPGVAVTGVAVAGGTVTGGVTVLSAPVFLILLR